MHRVVALTAPGVAPFELGCVVEVFGLRRPELDVPWWYELRVAAETPGPLPATAGGFSFFVEHGLEALADADTIVVPGWHGEPSAEVVEAVRAAHARGARLVSICSGVFLHRRHGPARRPGGGDALALRGPAGASSTPPSPSTPTCSTSTTGAC